MLIHGKGEYIDEWEGINIGPRQHAIITVSQERVGVFIAGTQSPFFPRLSLALPRPSIDWFSNSLTNFKEMNCAWLTLQIPSGSPLWTYLQCL